MKNKFAFSFFAFPGNAAREAWLLSKSIREFGGRFSECKILLMVPNIKALSDVEEKIFTELNVSIQHFEINEDKLLFPFGGKTMAAGVAERILAEKVETMVWMDCDSILFREPGEMFLNEGTHLGYRPVDHTLIGSNFNQPLDEFWQMIYKDCQVNEENIFPMMTSVDENEIRPYFNAGMLIVRPKDGVLQKWAKAFDRLFSKERYLEHYGKSALYKIFFHQAVLTGVLLSGISKESITELPHIVNYPLHMHEKYPDSKRIQGLEELISCRYDQFFDGEGWEEKIPA